MKTKLGRMGVAVLALVWINSLLAQDILFTNKYVTFADTSGRIYTNVMLVKSRADGLVWRENIGVGGGVVPASKLSPETLQLLGVPVERIQQAKARAEQKAAAAAAQAQAQPATADDALLKQIGETAAKMLPEQPEDAASASGQIKGAFGLKLGQVFDLKYATSTNLTRTTVTRRDKTALCDKKSYSFIPRHPLPHFSYYSVETTPCSNLLYCITAVSDEYEYSSMTQDDCDKLLVALEEKYGRAHLMKDEDTTYCSFKQGSVELTLSSAYHKAHEGQSAYSYLCLNYRDTALGI
jgi:hypothetical protein